MNGVYMNGLSPFGISSGRGGGGRSSNWGEGPPGGEKLGGGRSA